MGVMKKLLFIFTICSVGRIINVQGQYESDSDSGSDNPPSLLSEEKAEEAGTEDDRYSSESTGDAEVTGNENGESASSSSSSSSSEKEILGQNLGGPPGFLLSFTKEHQEQTAMFNNEMLAGDPADLIGQNEHVRQSNVYNDLGRRSMSQESKKATAENDDYLTPEKAPPELVLLVAKESAILGPGKDADLESDFDPKKILRSGDYWNGVWKEEVTPKSALRSGTQKKNLGSIKAKINEGTELYKVVSKMKEMSPKLLYIINKKQL